MHTCNKLDRYESVSLTTGSRSPGIDVGVRTADGGLRSAVLSADRGGVLNANGLYSAKESALTAGWVDEPSGVTTGCLSS